MGGRLLDYIAQGPAASRPLAADMDALIATGAASVYYSNDTLVFSFYNAATIAWDELSVGNLFSTLADVDWSTPPTDGQIFEWDSASSKLIPVDKPTTRTDEEIQDIVGAMIVVGGMYLTATYDDVAGTVTLETSLTQYTDEMSMDAVAAMVAAGTHVGVTVTYDDVTNSLSFTADAAYIDGRADARIAAASIDDLSDVDTTTTPPTDGQALVWVDAESLWKPGDVASGGGGGGATTQVPMLVGIFEVATPGDNFIAVPLDADDGHTYQVIVRGTPSVDATFRFRISDDNGATVKTGAADYKNGGTASSDHIVLSATQGAGREFQTNFVLSGMNEAASPRRFHLAGIQYSVLSAGSTSQGPIGGSANALVAGNWNGFHIYCSAGNMDDVEVVVIRVNPGATVGDAGAGTMAGTEFPTSPATNDRFFRTDRRIEYFYDGTRWLSTHLYVLEFNSLVGLSSDGFYERAIVPFKGVYSLWLEDLITCSFINSAVSWDIELSYADVTNTFTLIAQTNTTGDVANNWSQHITAIDAELNAAAFIITLWGDEISGSSTTSAVGMVTYRLIG